MSWKLLTLCVAGTAFALGGCGREETGNEATAEQPGEAAKAGGNQTIAAGLEQNSRFFQAAKAAGLDATLAGPGPYTVLVPTDQAFGALPQGRFEDLSRPDNRAELTRILTYHILPGTVLVEDIGKAIDNANGRAVLATMGGETLSAAREGDRIVLTDTAGGRAVVAQGDLQRSNGVVHVIDGVLMPGAAAAAEAEEAAPAKQ